MNSFNQRIEMANWRTVFGVPTIIGLLSLSGLFSALLFEGIGRYFSWIAVGSPILVTSWLFAKRLLRSSWR
jgi:hypothetical protein